MNVLLLVAHPNPASFNHAIAHTVADVARRAGHEVCLHDLYAEGFDAAMPAAELDRAAVLPQAIEHYCREVDQADYLGVVHPNWWSAPPAILRGWTDRCLRAGRAYNFVPDGQGGARPVGLLKVRAGLVLNTANTPQEIEERVFGDPLQAHWVKVVFGLCGVSRVLRRNFAPIITSSAEQRAGWLEDSRQLAAQWLAT